MLSKEGQNKNVSESSNQSRTFSSYKDSVTTKLSALTSTEKGKYITLAFIGFITVAAVFAGYFYLTDEEYIAVRGDNVLYEKLNQLDQDLSFISELDHQSSTEYFLEAGGHFEPGVDLYKVGDEYITSDDFNMYFYENYPSSYYNDIPLTGDQIKEAREELIKQSVLAQEFAQENNNLAENLHTDRNRSYDQYLDRGSEIDKEIINRINENAPTLRGESISIWFYNMVPPPMGVDLAREIAYQKMSDLKDSLDGGEIDMRGAAEIIVNDSQLEQINPASKTNAYSEINSAFGMDVFFDDDLNDVLYSLSVGEYSDILVGKDYGGGQEFDAYYTILHVSEISGGGSLPDDLYEEIKGDYPITEL